MPVFVTLKAPVSITIRKLQTIPTLMDYFLLGTGNFFLFFFFASPYVNLTYTCVDRAEQRDRVRVRIVVYFPTTKESRTHVTINLSSTPQRTTYRNKRIV